MVKSIDSSLYGYNHTKPTFISKLYENTTRCTREDSVSPFICDMAFGSTFYIPLDYVFTSNIRVIIKNVPLDPTKSYTISLIYRQPTTTFHATTARCIDTCGRPVLGSLNTFSQPLFNAGSSISTVTPT